jgi:hypothetical protein
MHLEEAHIDKVRRRVVTGIILARSGLLSLSKGGKSLWHYLRTLSPFPENHRKPPKPMTFINLFINTTIPLNFTTKFKIHR